MLVYLLRGLGVTPEGSGKTGKREAAWMLIGIALLLTGFSMYQGIEMVGAMTAILMFVWPAAIAALVGAYKLEHDKGSWTAGEPAG